MLFSYAKMGKLGLTICVKCPQASNSGCNSIFLILGRRFNTEPQYRCKTSTELAVPQSYF